VFRSVVDVVQKAEKVILVVILVSVKEQLAHEPVKKQPLPKMLSVQMEPVLPGTDLVVPV